MDKKLPARPNLEQLKKQAAELGGELAVLREKPFAAFKDDLRGIFFIDHNTINVTGPDQAWSSKTCGRQQRR